MVAGVWIAVQLLVPLRHFLIPGDPSWTEQAHRFSWHMRLRDKQSTVTFVVGDGDRGLLIDSGSGPELVPAFEVFDAVGRVRDGRADLGAQRLLDVQDVDAVARTLHRERGELGHQEPPMRAPRMAASARPACAKSSSRPG